MAAVQERTRTPGWIWPAVAVLLLAQVLAVRDRARAPDLPSATAVRGAFGGARAPAGNLRLDGAVAQLVRAADS